MLSNNDLASEFRRRLIHQVRTALGHARICTLDAEHCIDGKLLKHAINDSVTTLKGLGYAREAAMIISNIMGHGEGGQ